MAAPTTESVLSRVVIRSAEPDDARGIIDLMKELALEPGINLSYIYEEADVPLEKEQDRIRSLEDSLHIVVEDRGEIVGELSLNKDRWALTGHIAYLGMLLRKRYRNQGLGTEMLRHGIEWASRNRRIQKIELEVFARNHPAIHLYEKFGFEIEGRKRNAIYRDGEYLDMLIMGLML